MRCGRASPEDESDGCQGLAGFRVLDVGLGVWGSASHHTVDCHVYSPCWRPSILGAVLSWGQHLTRAVRW